MPRETKCHGICLITRNATLLVALINMVLRPLGTQHYGRVSDWSAMLDDFGPRNVRHHGRVSDWSAMLDDFGIKDGHFRGRVPHLKQRRVR
jgi:hypothetical protein